MTSVSVVIPVYRGAESLPILIPRLVDVLQQQGYLFEVICVHDCGPDDSLRVLCQLAEQYRQLKVVGLSRNFGQENAILAGFRFVRYEIVVCMDEDLQHDPADVPKLIAELLHKNLDVVFAKFTDKTRSASRRFGTWFNDYMMRKAIQKPPGLALTSFLALRRFIVDSIQDYAGPYPYLAGLYLTYSSAVGNVELTEHERPHGESSYDFRKLMSVWVNGLVNFSILPLRVVFVGGLVALTLSVIATVVLMINRILDPNLPLGWTLVMITIVAFAGVQSLALGILGEYIGRILMIGTRKPAFSVRSVIGQELARSAPNSNADPTPPAC
jgi:polyisoprenyl-phosphate glycosyltransferase